MEKSKLTIKSWISTKLVKVSLKETVGNVVVKMAEKKLGFLIKELHILLQEAKRNIQIAKEWLDRAKARLDAVSWQ